jgi:hypothetical protein
MQRIIIAILAMGVATSATVAIYFCSKVDERDAQIAALEKDSKAAKQASNHFEAQATLARAALHAAKEENLRLKAERDAALKASETAMLRRDNL